MRRRTILPLLYAFLRFVMLPPEARSTLGLVSEAVVAVPRGLHSPAHRKIEKIIGGQVQLRPFQSNDGTTHCRSPALSKLSHNFLCYVSLVGLSVHSNALYRAWLNFEAI